MLPTVFASFRDPLSAEPLIGALRDLGIAPEDLSVIVKGQPNGNNGNRGEHLVEGTEGLALVDAGEDPTRRFGYDENETEGSYVYESRIGGGISTSSPDDDVSMVAEMDDSQEAAEEMSYPASAQSYGSQERFDVAYAAEKGFFGTNDPGPEGLGLKDTGETDPTPFELELSSVHIPAFGVALGDGALATQVIGAGIASETGGRPAARIQDYLEDQGVDRDLAFLLASDFEEGGAVVAIATPPGGLDSDVLQRVLEDNGAGNVSLVEARDV